MEIPGKEIFENDRVLLVGYSSDPSSFSRMVYRELEDAGLDVYPYNPKVREYDIEVYSNLDLIEPLPKTAVVLVSSANIDGVMDQLSSRDIKSVIINKKMGIDQSILDKCNRNGIEVKFFCPLLIVGKGFHKIHKFFATLF